MGNCLSLIVPTQSPTYVPDVPDVPTYVPDVPTQSPTYVQTYVPTYVQLSGCRPRPASDFSLEGKVCRIIIPKDGIYDGDTFKAQFSIYPDSPIEQFRIRMYGYDSPEMKPLKSKENCCRKN